MAHSLSARKRIRQNEKRRLRNRRARSVVKTQVKQCLAVLEQGDAQAAQDAFQAAVRALDKAVTKGVMHKNTASRRKSRLAARLKKLAPATQS